MKLKVESQIYYNKEFVLKEFVNLPVADWRKLRKFSQIIFIS